jgi:hypothetical protein
VAADEGVVQKDNPPDPTQHEAGPDVPPPDVAPTCPVQAVTGDSCHAAAACSLLCAGDAAWEGKCTAELTADLKDGHDALVDCLAALDCQATENEVFSSCARTGCKPEIESCFAGAGKCKEIWMCRKKCSAEDPACPLRCQGIGTVAEQEAWVEYVGCVFGVECAQTQQMPNGWPIETCEGSDVHMNCAVKYQACMGL